MRRKALHGHLHPGRPVFADYPTLEDVLIRFMRVERDQSSSLTNFRRSFPERRRRGRLSRRAASRLGATSIATRVREVANLAPGRANPLRQCARNSSRFDRSHKVLPIAADAQAPSARSSPHRLRRALGNLNDRRAPATATARGRKRFARGASSRAECAMKRRTPGAFAAGAARQGPSKANPGAMGPTRLISNRATSGGRSLRPSE
jgi:hypothetical protein